MLKQAWMKWSSFWFEARDPMALHVVRVLLGVMLIAWLLPLAGNAEAWFGMQGWFDLTAYRTWLGSWPEAMQPPIPATWSAHLQPATEAGALAVYWSTLGLAVLLVVGIFPRLVAPAAWLAVVILTTNPVVAFGAEDMLRFVAFYVALGYFLQGSASSAGWLTKITGGWAGPFRRNQASVPSTSANFAIRLLQIHFVVIVAASGLHKLQMGMWWSGYGPWFWINPAGTTVAELQSLRSIRDSYFLALSLWAYAVLAWQLCFGFVAWRPGLMRTGFLTIGAFAAVMSGPLLGWPMFGLVWLACLAGFVRSETWNAFFARVLGRRAALVQEASSNNANSKISTRKNSRRSNSPVGV